MVDVSPSAHSRCGSRRLIGRSIRNNRDAPLEIYLAAGGPLVAEDACRAGDGFIATSGNGMELSPHKLISAVRKGVDGEKFEDIDRMLAVEVSYDSVPERALQPLRRARPGHDQERILTQFTEDVVPLLR